MVVGESETQAEDCRTATIIPDKLSERGGWRWQTSAESDRHTSSGGRYTPNGRTAKTDFPRSIRSRHRASLRHSKTSPKRYTSDSATQTSASVRACAAPSGKRSDVQTEPRTRAARLRERSETLKLFYLFCVPFVGLCYNFA